MKTPKQITGNIGEDLAKRFLISKGFQIVCQNYRYGRNEIDLVCLDDDFLVFVEVKTRKNNDFGYPEEFVTLSKQRAIARVAKAFLQKNPSQAKIRFDIVAITKTSPKWSIHYVPDAFYPSAL